MRWAVVVTDDVHVVPIDDLVAHDLNDSCVCGPTPDPLEPRLSVHHSLDGRELLEA